MKNDPFEDELRKLPWRQAPEGLKERLFPPQEEEEAPISLRDRIARYRAPLALAASFVILIGSAMVILNQSPDIPTAIELEIAMAEHGSHNFFDLSTASPDFWPQAVELEVLP